MRKQPFIMIIPILLLIGGCGGKNNHFAPPAPTESAAPADAGGRNAASYVSTCEVTTSVDSTATGTLRYCITYANSNPGPDTITFSAPMEIRFTYAPPNMTGGGTTIVNTTSGEVLVLGGPFPAFHIRSANNVIRGLTIGHAYDTSPDSLNYAILIYGPYSSNNIIAGNYIGTNISGTRGILQPSLSNEVGVFIDHAAGNNIIGGSTPADRNIISSNTGIGVAIAHSNGNKIMGNYIGTSPEGNSARPNGVGIHLFDLAAANIIGGSGPGEGNLISGNTEHGIAITNNSMDNEVYGNYIGTTSTGSGAFPNGKTGVYVASGATRNKIGGVAQGQRNIIAFNGDRGVVVTYTFMLGSANATRISGNIIHSNTGLGIDLSGFGANSEIAPPAITEVVDVGSNHTVRGSAVCNNPPCVVELFRADTPMFFPEDPSGAGEAVAYIGSETLTSTSSFQFTNVSIGHIYKITATLTDANMNTSEFAINRAVPPANPPSVSNCVFLPSTILANGAATTSLSCNVSNPGKVIGPVAANLSSIGGSSAAAMTLFSVDQFKSVFVIDGVTSPPGTTPGAKSVVVTARNTEGLAGSSSASLTLIDPSAPAVSGCVYTPSTLASDNISAATLKCLVSDIENNVSNVSVNLSGLGGSAAVAMSRVTGGNYWQKTGIKVATSILPGAVSTPVTATDATGKTGAGSASLTVKEPNSKPVVNNCAFSPSSVRSNNLDSTTLSCSITDAESNVSAVAVNLGAIGGSTGAPMTNMGGGIWRRTNIKVPGSVLSGAALVTVKALDAKSSVGTGTATLTVAPAPPTITYCSIAPNSIPNDGTSASTIQCKVSDPNNDVAGVSANLTDIGGSGAAALTFVSGTTWEKSGVTVPGGVATGAHSITVTATDSAGVSSAPRSVSVTVRVPNSRPSVSGCAFSPASLPRGGVATATLTCTVSDADSNLSAVAVDLSAVGGSAGAPLANIGGNTWRRTGVKTSVGALAGSYSLPITAKDYYKASASMNAPLTVAP